MLRELRRRWREWKYCRWGNHDYRPYGVGKKAVRGELVSVLVSKCADCPATTTHGRTRSDGR